MDLPDISPALLRATGDGFAQKLQARLIELADATDDEAYASRLRLVASGRRPLRTLLSDPKWSEAFAPQIQILATPPELDEDRRRALDDAVARAGQRVVLPSEVEIASDLEDVMRRAALTEAAIREDELNGWAHVHGDADHDEDPAPGER
ncbi:hypothetical protein [Schumannella soli]|uniref:Uncharacterized protein n=1 Tax=Schumannella soli TaxID=2590779 RepID=A0A506Y1G6_9MICO|nr:hypothetical protein [Schumannella soli]TPW75802.1 hypothetical protein FJ657_08035 [Schumannella soli]